MSFFIEFMKCMQIASHGGFIQGQSKSPEWKRRGLVGPSKVAQEPWLPLGFPFVGREEEEMVARGRMWVIFCCD